MILDIRDQLAAILNADTQILSCGATVTLDALSSALGTQTSIEWSRDGIPDSSQLNASSWEITEAGWYRVTLFDSLSMCTSSDSLLITQDTNIPDFNFNIETGDCGDDRIVLVLGNHTVYQSLTINDMMWPLSSAIDIDLMGQTALDIVVVRNDGCVIDTMTQVQDSGGLFFDLGDDIELAPGESFDLDPDFVGDPDSWTYDWSLPALLSCTSCLDPRLTPSSTQAASSLTLSLTATDSEGCVFTDSLLVHVAAETVDSTSNDGFYMPTVFTPNGIDNQRLLAGVDINRIAAVEVFIYDRWGNLIANRSVQGPLTDNSLFIWDGTHDGQPIEVGVYTYMATLLHTSSEESSQVGTITLIR